MTTEFLNIRKIYHLREYLRDRIDSDFNLFLDEITDFYETHRENLYEDEDINKYINNTEDPKIKHYLNKAKLYDDLIMFKLAHELDEICPHFLVENFVIGDFKVFNYKSKHINSKETVIFKTHCSVCRTKIECVYLNGQTFFDNVYEKYPRLWFGDYCSTVNILPVSKFIENTMLHNKTPKYLEKIELLDYVSELHIKEQDEFIIRYEKLKLDAIENEKRRIEELHDVERRKSKFSSKMKQRLINRKQYPLSNSPGNYNGEVIERDSFRRDLYMGKKIKGDSDTEEDSD